MTLIYQATQKPTHGDRVPQLDATLPEETLKESKRCREEKSRNQTVLLRLSRTELESDQGLDNARQ